MNKKLLIVVSAGLIAILIVTVILLWSLQARRDMRANARPTPVPSPTTIIKRTEAPTEVPTRVPTPLALISANPDNEATDVPLNAEIVLRFNQQVRAESFIFAIDPYAEHEISYASNEATVVFRNLLDQGTNYLYRVNTLTQLPRSYTFTTIDGLSEEEALLRFRPEEFLNAQLPYEGDQFTLVSRYSDNTESYIFIVEDVDRVNMEERVELVNQYIRSLGITEDQIGELTIYY